MVTITSSTQSADEIKQALESAGQTVVEDAPVPAPEPAKPAAPPAKDGKSEKAGEPGAADGAPADPAVETAPPPEDGEPSAQGNDAEPAGGDQAPGQHRRRGNFKTKIEKLQIETSRLQRELDGERGDKTRLRQELEEARAKLAELTKPAETTTPKSDEPVRPKRPRLEDFDYDNEKFAAAETAYDDDLDKYYKAVADKQVKDAIAAKEADERKRSMETEAERRMGEYRSRIDAGAAEIPDYDEVFQELMDSDIDPELPDVVEAAIIESEIPAEIMYFFFKDALENDSKELSRISKLHPVAQVRELTKLETRLAAEREKRKGAPPEPAAAAPPPAAPPAKPAERVPAKPKAAAKPVEEPITPVGSRSSSPAMDTLEAAAARGDMKAYWAIRARQKVEQQGGGIPGR